MSESEDRLFTAGPNTLTGEVELRAFCPGGEAGASVSSGTGEL